jgi:undecaprenyl-diphosphatase
MRGTKLMTLLQAIILGILQGLTEFIPVSSSGHLVLIPHVFGWEFSKSQAFIFDVLVQWGTLFAVLFYFRRDLINIASAFVGGLMSGKPFVKKDARMGWYLILATIPAVFIGLLYKDLIETAFTSAKATGFFLLITSALLILAETVGKRNRSIEDISWYSAFWIGCSQVLSLLPGVSRSGATIAGGMTRNLDREAAARFSFLMSVPVMLGAGVLAIKDLFELPTIDNFLGPLIVGFLVAMVSGYIAIRWFITYLCKHSLSVFAVYCLLIGFLAIFLI